MDKTNRDDNQAPFNRSDDHNYRVDRDRDTEFGSDVTNRLGESDFRVDRDRDTEFANEVAPIPASRSYDTDPRVDRDRDTTDTEFGAEIPSVPFGYATDRKERREEDRRERGARGRVAAITTGRGLGITAIILAVLSFFFLPFVLSIAGIVLGVISVRRGSRLGWWAIALGAVALILSTFVMLPFRYIF